MTPYTNQPSEYQCVTYSTCGIHNIMYDNYKILTISLVAAVHKVKGHYERK